ncbi:MAG: HlyD family secretion protein [Hyphomonas sp.]|uniref:HlyD family secretion protein n=1 Tax=Hyphomonas sp. TaxID=87 RepID=UPI00183A10F3|nr:HlyD family secretion protein [Hyphomonas sp.]MBA3068760.1 HlyD family secretion protein [Hyphomonas sp.]MBU3919176.1 HlyD family secretion protein [Alphaproteobacteria bacterium]MBU4062693.1 HlyD family secretion protein [Alphaproteobacteria bacterium]MBU4166201.1 HlyD family secretion protein [Alphaproteobacteria bacterium]
MDGDTQLLTEAPPTLRQQATSLLKSPRARRWMAAGAALVFLLVTVRFLLDRAAYVSTADARVAADMIAVSTDISGRITSVAVSEGDQVTAGDVLYTIDDREAVFTLAEYEAEASRLRAEIAREEARAGLATSKAGSQVAARQAGTRSASASVEAARSNLETAQQEHDRTKNLLDQGRIPKSTYDQAKNALETAQQALLRAQAERETAAAEQRTASISGEEVRLSDFDLSVLHAKLDQAEARVAAQKVVLEQHTIRAPVDGMIDELFYDAGEHSLHGFRMALMHDPAKVWVSANIKETDIRNIHPGASVQVRADSNPGNVIKGHVTGIRETTLSEASMMPNPNASGVFTKITQRIKVRIKLDPSDVHLRAGTMVRVRIAKSDRPPAKP